MTPVCQNSSLLVETCASVGGGGGLLGHVDGASSSIAWDDTSIVEWIRRVLPREGRGRDLSRHREEERRGSKDGDRESDHAQGRV